MMMTIRSHDQFNTTIYGMNDRYRGVYNERRVIFMNEEDIRQQGLQKDDIVDLYNEQGGIQRVAHRFIVVPYPIPRTCAATYYPKRMCWSLSQRGRQKQYARIQISRDQGAETRFLIKKGRRKFAGLRSFNRTSQI